MVSCIETVADKELEIKTLENNTLHSHKKNTSYKKYKNNGDGVSGMLWHQLTPSSCQTNRLIIL